MNFKDMKKVHEDNEKAVFKNSNGHALTVAKKALSPKLLNDLKGLKLHAAAGEDIKRSVAEDMEDKTIPEQPQAAGAAPASESLFDEDRAATQEPTAQPSVADEMAQAQGSGAVPFKIPEAPLAPDRSKEIADINERRQRAIAGQPDQGAQPPPSVPPATAPTPSSQNPADTYTKSYNDTMAMHADEFGKEAAKTAMDLNTGHITPQHYDQLIENKGLPGKVASLFGLLLSGAGSGLAHQPNMVLEMMNKEIERDVDAQQKSKTNAQNLFKLNLENERNKALVGLSGAQQKSAEADANIKAVTLTKDQLLLGLNQKLLGLAPSFPTAMQPQTQAMLQQVGQGVTAKMQQNHAEAAKQLVDNPDGVFQERQQILRAQQLMGEPQAGAIADIEQSKHVPGIGNATIPVPQNIRENLISRQKYDAAAKRYVDFAKKHFLNFANLNLAQRQAITAQGEALGADVQNKYRDATNGGVFKNGEQTFIRTSVPDQPASWKAYFDAIPKVEETITNNHRDMQQTGKGYGLHIPDNEKAQEQRQPDVFITPSGKKAILHGTKLHYLKNQ